jgi:polymorphic toxin system nucleotidyltransferase-like protein
LVASKAVLTLPFVSLQDHNDFLLARTHEHARNLARNLTEIDAIWLFGSLARREAKLESDIDLLVLSNRPIRGRDLKASLGAYSDPVSFALHTPASLARRQAEDWSFFVHVQHEGDLLFDRRGDASSHLRPFNPPSSGTTARLHEELKFLRRYDNTESLQGSFFFPLARLYAVVKQVVMADNTAAGFTEFDRGRAFDLFATRYPDLGLEIGFVRNLWPFLAVTKGRQGESPPFSAFGAEENFARARTATQRVIEAALG